MGNNDELRRMEADLRADEGLRTRLEEAARRAADAGAASDGVAMAAAAAELGYRVSAADLERSVAGGEELDLDELAGVAGGTGRVDKNGKQAWCWFNYHCYAAIRHDEGGTTYESCWSHYRCLFVNDREF